MTRRYLMQRFSQPPSNLPTEGPLAKLATEGNPFAFGGGLKNGGLHPEAQREISKFLWPDYMGAAEYEWGAYPKALQHILDNFAVYSTHEYNKKERPFYLYCHEKDAKHILEDLEKHFGEKTEHTIVRDGTMIKYLDESFSKKLIAWLHIGGTDDSVASNYDRAQPFFMTVSPEAFKHFLELFRPCENQSHQTT